MNVWLDTIIAQGLPYMCTNLNLIALSDPEIFMYNLANYPLESLKHASIDTCFGYGNVRLLHKYIKNSILICLKLINMKGNSSQLTLLTELCLVS